MEAVVVVPDEKASIMGNHAFHVTVKTFAERFVDSLRVAVNGYPFIERHTVHDC